MKRSDFVRAVETAISASGVSAEDAEKLRKVAWDSPAFNCWFTTEPCCPLSQADIRPGELFTDNKDYTPRWKFVESFDNEIQHHFNISDVSNAPEIIYVEDY